MAEPKLIKNPIMVVQSGEADLGTKTITENGTYSASSDNLDGYSSVTVNVPSSDPNEQLAKVLSGTATFVKIRPSTPVVNSSILPTNSRSCAYWSIRNRNADYWVDSGFFGFGQNVPGRKTLVNMDNVIDVINRLFFNAVVKTLIITSTAVGRLSGSLYVEANTAIYVRDSTLSAFKAASNWSQYGDVLKGYSEAPDYNSSTTYEISDVCKYNGKFYSYCKSDLTPSSGNTPTGTADDNDYWEYVAEVNS